MLTWWWIINLSEEGTTVNTWQRRVLVVGYVVGDWGKSSNVWQGFWYGIRRGNKKLIFSFTKTAFSSNLTPSQFLIKINPFIMGSTALFQIPALLHPNLHFPNDLLHGEFTRGAIRKSKKLPHNATAFRLTVPPPSPRLPSNQLPLPQTLSTQT